MKVPHNLQLPKLRKLIGIPEFGDLEQDWDLIMANSEWVGQLLDYYENENLNDDEKNILMQLIIASYDEKLNEGKNDLAEETKLTAFLEKDIEIHKDIFEYWARLHEIESEGWAVTPMLRKIWFNNGENKI
jgi:hypothetical protein